MNNTEAIAAEWVARLAGRPEFPFAGRLSEHFKRARITSLCQCGCQSFQCEVDTASEPAPLFAEKQNGISSFEAAFATDNAESITVVFHANNHGLLAGIDITWGLSNHASMPEDVVLDALLYTIPDL